VMDSEGVRECGKYSRLAFFDVCIFVTASEGEELVVDIIGRHGDGDWGSVSRWFRVYSGGDGGGNGVARQPWAGLA
jgi:hypothetical protein